MGNCRNQPAPAVAARRIRRRESNRSPHSVAARRGTRCVCRRESRPEGVWPPGREVRRTVVSRSRSRTQISSCPGSSVANARRLPSGEKRRQLYNSGAGCSGSVSPALFIQKMERGGCARQIAEALEAASIVSESRRDPPGPGPQLGAHPHQRQPRSISWDQHRSVYLWPLGV
jgi:hypothetical protein